MKEDDSKSDSNKEKGLAVGRLRGLVSCGAQRQNRTADTRIFSPLLYRLSYLGKTRKLFITKPLWHVKAILS